MTLHVKAYPHWISFLDWKITGKTLTNPILILKFPVWISCDSAHLRLQVCYCLASRNNLMSLNFFFENCGEKGKTNFTQVVNVLL